MNRLFAIIALLLFPLISLATHNRAGEISYKRIAPFSKVVGGVTVQVYTYSITITKYTNDGEGIADRCLDTVSFGDGEKGIAPRINGSPLGGCKCGTLGTVAIGCGSIIINQTTSIEPYRVKLNTYTITHTYPGPGSYVIRSLDPNRNDKVQNIPNSLYVPFYIESLLIINGFTGTNSSPVFTFPPVDKACVNACFMHNPGAYDPDLKDSLSYEITTSRGANGDAATGYTFPYPGPNGSFGINASTGLLSWCTPQTQGQYNIAFIVKEWRKNTSDNYELIGYVLRDMQVIVEACPNNTHPVIVVPKDTCVEAGTVVQKNVVVKDAEGGLVTLEGGGGPFNTAVPLASLAPLSAVLPTNGNFTSKFEWPTSCNHVRSIPFQATFKASDKGSPVNQVAFASFNIKVVAPAIKSITATPQGSNIKISWAGATCNPTNNPVVAYKVYRKNDCATYSPSPCQTSLPEAYGFTLVAETSATINDYVDTNNGEGLVVGQNYSYIVLAVYKDGAVTYSGAQYCTKLRRNVPVLLNVDVLSTSATGSVALRWIRPILDKENLDTTQYINPYKLEVMYWRGNSAQVVSTYTAQSILSLPLSYTHSSINTSDTIHVYTLRLSSGNDYIGDSQKATSVFLSPTAGDRKIILNWASKTPWNNYKYTVYRKDPGSATYTAVATTSLTNYTDQTNIANRFTYCYYIESEGKYSDTSIIHPLLNRSQEACAKAVDLIPPCAPTITISADCETGFVKIEWNNVRLACNDSTRSDDVVAYDLYFKSTLGVEYNKLASYTNTMELKFVPDANPLIAGCYKIVAIDSSGNKSEQVTDYCIDNCPEFELPNIFTPNDDNVNETFKAIKVRQIQSIDLIIYDRWGNAIYRTKDPYFQWDGISRISNLPVSSGAFFYICDVYEPRLKGIVKRTIKGYFHVAR